MVRKKRVVVTGLILLVGLIAGLIFWTLYHGRTSGDNVLDYFRMENIIKVTVKKTIENGDGIRDCGTVELNQAQTEEFYKVFSETQMKDIGTRGFLIHTEIRYYVFFYNAEGCAEGTMKFYEDEVLLFDYVYGDRPFLHKRYTIASSFLKDFFESIFP